MGSAAVLLVMVAPVVGALWAVLGRARTFPRESERLLFALVLLPVVLLAEVLVLTLAPIDRPLRVLLPWAHWAVVAASLVFLWHGRDPARSRLRCVASRARRIWRATDVATRAALIVAAVAALAAAAWAAWNAGDEHDGAMYRLVVALQPYQDGSVGRIRYHLDDLADAYPRTVELLYSWTALCLGNSVGLHLVNWSALVMFGLAAYVAGRRAGLPRRDSLLCTALCVTTPMPIYLTGILYNDLPACAPLVAAAAFAIPPRRRAWGPWDVGACAVSLALGASSKLTIAIGAAVVGLSRLSWMLLRRRAPSSGERRGVGPGACGFAFAVAALVASTPYVRSWVIYGSPVWPLRLGLGSAIFFDGPMRSESLFITASGSWSHRWATALFKLFQTTSQDANGAFGLLFAIGVLPGAIVFAWRALRAPTFSGVLLLVLFFSVFLLPPSTNLRYSMQILPAGYVMLHLLLRSAPRAPVRRFGPSVVCLLLVINAADYGRTLVREVMEQFRWGVSWADPARNRRWYEQFQWLPGGIAPDVHAVVQAAVQPGERLVYSVQTLGGFLYDPFYRYAIEYRSIPYWTHRTNRGHSPGSQGDAPGWLASLSADHIAAVLVYGDSPEDNALAAAGSPFLRIYEQPPHHNLQPVCIYRASDTDHPPISCER